MKSAWKSACPMMNAGIEQNVKNTRRNKCTQHTQSYTAYTHIHATCMYTEHTYMCIQMYTCQEHTQRSTIYTVIHNTHDINTFKQHL